MKIEWHKADYDRDTTTFFKQPFLIFKNGYGVNLPVIVMMILSFAFIGLVIFDETEYMSKGARSYLMFIACAWGFIIASGIFNKARTKFNSERETE
jgi:hypothetical protein